MPRRPAVRPSAPWHFPSADKMTLPNALDVECFDLPGQRVVTAMLQIDAPLTAEPRDREGVATLAMRALDEGTLPHPGAALIEALEGCGAATSDAGAGLDGASITIDAPATRLGEVLPLLAEMIEEPAFDPSDVTRLVESRLLAIATGQVSPPVRAGQALWAQLGAGHRIARPFGGDAASVAAITGDDLRVWHRSAARPGRARLLLAGELPSDIGELVTKAFGGWQTAAEATTPDAEPLPLPPAGRRVVVVDRPDAAQASLRIGTITPTRTHDDWPAMQVANAVTGAMFGSRLNAVLREQRGLTYGAASGLAPTRSAAFFTVQAECRPEVAAEATGLALSLLDLAANPVTPDEARDAIAYITGATPLHLATSDAIVAQAASFALGGVPEGWFDGYMDALRDVTADDATAAFARHIQPSDVVVALCGPAALLVPDLAAIGLDASVTD